MAIDLRFVILAACFAVTVVPQQPTTEEPGIEGPLVTVVPQQPTTEGSQCASSFYGREGNITSENYPWGYPPYDFSCFYYLNVHQSTSITFTFTSPFGIRNRGGHNGYLEFLSTSTALRYKVDGYSTPPSIYFKYDYYSQIQITYYSDSPYQEEGFSLNYTLESDNSSFLMMRNDYGGAQSAFFYRPLAEFKDGFGSLTSPYWVGLERLHDVSQYGTCRIRFDFQDIYKNWYFAEYSNFSVSDSSDNYRLSISGYSGNLYDGMERVDGGLFITYDVNNGISQDPNCAVQYGGGFWFNTYCGDVVRLTGSPEINFFWWKYLNYIEARLWC